MPERGYPAQTRVYRLPVLLQEDKEEIDKVVPQKLQATVEDADRQHDQPNPQRGQISLPPKRTPKTPPHPQVVGRTAHQHRMPLTT